MFVPFDDKFEVAGLFAVRAFACLLEQYLDILHSEVRREIVDDLVAEERTANSPLAYDKMPNRDKSAGLAFDMDFHSFAGRKEIWQLDKSVKI